MEDKTKLTEANENLLKENHRLVEENMKLKEDVRKGREELKKTLEHLHNNAYEGEHEVVDQLKMYPEAYLIDMPLSAMESDKNLWGWLLESLKAADSDEEGYYYAHTPVHSIVKILKAETDRQ